MGVDLTKATTRNVALGNANWAGALAEWEAIQTVQLAALSALACECATTATANHSVSSRHNQPKLLEAIRTTIPTTGYQKSTLKRVHMQRAELKCQPFWVKLSCSSLALDEVNPH